MAAASVCFSQERAQEKRVGEAVKVGEAVLHGSCIGSVLDPAGGLSAGPSLKEKG